MVYVIYIIRGQRYSFAKVSQACWAQRKSSGFPVQHIRYIDAKGTWDFLASYRVSALFEWPLDPQSTGESIWPRTVTCASKPLHLHFSLTWVCVHDSVDSCKNLPTWPLSQSNMLCKDPHADLLTVDQGRNIWLSADTNRTSEPMALSLPRLQRIWMVYTDVYDEQIWCVLLQNQTKGNDLLIWFRPNSCKDDEHTDDTTRWECRSGVRPVVLLQPYMNRR